jgi:N-acetylneuraminic acid mutarotase
MKRRVLVLPFLAAALAGCPAFVSDDYVVVDDTDAGGDAKAETVGDANVDVNDAGTDSATEDAPVDASEDSDAGAGNDAGTDAGTDANVDAGCGPCGNGRTCVSAVCTPSWVTMAAAPSGFAGRQHPAWCSMGSKLFVWGGAGNAAGSDLGDGAIYDPSNDTWSTIATTGAPTARIGAVAVWTGSVVVVWGGGDLAATTDYNTGARYNPGSNTWSAMSNGGAPSARRNAFAVWTGSRVLVFGGEQKNGSAVGNAGLYDPVNDVWSNTAGGAPPSALSPAVGWNGASFYVYGGRAGANDVATLSSYTPSSNTWAPLTAGPAAREAAFGAVDGANFVVWGGINGTTLKSDGARYATAGTTWTPLGTTGAPVARQAVNRVSGWAANVASGVTLLVGGQGSASTDFKKDGAIYDSAADKWTAVSAWPSGADHEAAAAVWTGTEFVIWGGRNAGSVIATGERFKP